MNKNHYLIQLCESPKTDFGKIAFSAQSEEQKVFSAIWALESQVNGGGFVTHFSSDDGETASFAPRALRRIGADACAAIVERALALVSSDALPIEFEARSRLVANLPETTLEALGTLDSAFFAYPNNLTELLFEFVRYHPNIFGHVTDTNGG